MKRSNMDLADIYTEGNRDCAKREKITSPSGKYLLIIDYYEKEDKAKKLTLRYTKGSIRIKKTNTLVTEIFRNFYCFEYYFFFKDNKEWLLCGKTPLSQCFIDLDSCKIYENTDISNEHNYYWGDDVKISPDATKLTVLACIWGKNFELHVYDISKIENGWHRIDVDYSKLGDFDYYKRRIKWLDDETLELISYRTKEEYSVNLPKENIHILNNFNTSFAYKVILTFNGKEFVTSDYNSSDFYKLYLDNMEK